MDADESMLRIAIVGCGAVGSAVLDVLRHEPGISVGWIVLRPGDQAFACDAAGRLAPNAQLVTHLADTECIDLLVECAGHTAIEQHVLPALARGIRCLVASVGAVSAPGMAQRLEAAARCGGTEVQLLSGAIGGIDALSAARLGGLTSVSYIGRKPPHAWKGTPAEETCDLESLTQAHCIFEGTAQEAARLYPKNANVAATVSIAGLGLEHTQVRLFADPGVSENVHDLEVRGAFGTMKLTISGKPLAANPKTSALTVYSIVRAIANCRRAMTI
jgi:aspartate dehydrogenase